MGPSKSLAALCAAATMLLGARAAQAQSAAFGIFPSARMGYAWGEVPSPTSAGARIGGAALSVDLLANALVTLPGDRVAFVVSSGYAWQGLGGRAAMRTSALWFRSVPLLATVLVSPVNRLSLQAGVGLQVGELEREQNGLSDAPAATVGWRAHGGLTVLVINFPNVSLGLSLDATHSQAHTARDAFVATGFLLGVSMAWMSDALALR